MEDQLNDLTELHQHETSDLKQELASIEEKVAYQAYERARDIQVMCVFTVCLPPLSCPNVDADAKNIFWMDLNKGFQDRNWAR